MFCFSCDRHIIRIVVNNIIIEQIVFIISKISEDINKDTIKDIISITNAIHLIERNIER